MWLLYSWVFWEKNSVIRKVSKCLRLQMDCSLAANNHTEFVIIQMRITVIIVYETLWVLKKTTLVCLWIITLALCILHQACQLLTNSTIFGIQICIIRWHCNPVLDLYWFLHIVFWSVNNVHVNYTSKIGCKVMSEIELRLGSTSLRLTLAHNHWCK